MNLINDDLRIIQYNLQIRDTEMLDPQSIADQLIRRNANAVVLNVGGIYAWYDSKVPYHHKNEFLPEGRELLKEIFKACHQKNIRVIGRFDFSKTDDTTYLVHPEWFVQDEQGGYVSYGSKRMGNWSLLLSTCLNGGYRNNEFAVPVLKEALRELPMDGIFLNAPHMEACWCDNCKRKYRKMFGIELPKDKKQWDNRWGSICVRDNVMCLNQAIKEVNADIPMILYYGTYSKEGRGPAENLDDRYISADMICTEAQNILSNGKDRLPDRFRPTINMKLGRLAGRPAPFGIIHSCPGMDWRHTGMPAAEYESWMSQVFPAGGQIWHSLTGFEAVITDKRILPIVERINEKCRIAADRQHNMTPVRSVLLLWDAGKSAVGYAQALIEGHIPFDIMDNWHVDVSRMREYPVIVVPDGFRFDETGMEVLEQYVKEGGNVFIQKTSRDETSGGELHSRLCELIGIQEDAVSGKDLCASYGVLEELKPADETLRRGLTDTEYLPVKGNVWYTRALEHSTRMMYLIPPFAPYDGVGAPPERASLPVKRTEIALLQKCEYGKGRVISCFFDLSGLISGYGLEDQCLLFENCIRWLEADRQVFDGSSLPKNVYSYIMQKENEYLIHLVNTGGERPIRQIQPWTDLSFELEDTRSVEAVEVLFDQGHAVWEKKTGRIHVTLDRLAVWNAIHIRMIEKTEDKTET